LFDSGLMGAGTDGRGCGAVIEDRGGGEVVALVARLTELTARLAACPVAGVVEPEASRAHAALRRAIDSLGVTAARLLARVEADGRWATTRTGRGSRTFEDWLARDSRSSKAGARRQARLARALDEEAVPGLGDAVAAGSISLEHADVLTRLGPTSPARRSALTWGDSGDAAFLLGQATRLPVEQFAKEVQRWAAKVDPGADERGFRDATARVSCVLSARDNGVAMSGFLTSVDGAFFETALKAVAGVPAADDPRTHDQRMGAALGQMARLVLDHGLAAASSGGFRPHLSVHVSWDTLIGHVAALSAAQTTTPDRPARDGIPSLPAGWDAAVLADGTPIPPSVLARLACDSEVSRVVFGPDSQVLDVGRAERLYTRALRRAVVARDAHCAYPGCYQPPALCEVHHVRHWAAHGGETSIGNGVLLCWWHHDVAHRRHLTIQRNHPTARWEFYEPDGSPIRHPDGPPAREADRADVPRGPRPPRAGGATDIGPRPPGDDPRDIVPRPPGDNPRDIVPRPPGDDPRDIGPRPPGDNPRDIGPCPPGAGDATELGHVAGHPGACYGSTGQATGEPLADVLGAGDIGECGGAPEGSLGPRAGGRSREPGLFDVA
jgi:hypothetical protein